MNGFNIKVGQRIINLLAIRNARRDGKKVWLNFIAGGFECLCDDEADKVWELLLESAIDLQDSHQGNSGR